MSSLIMIVATLKLVCVCAQSVILINGGRLLRQIPKVHRDTDTDTRASTQEAGTQYTHTHDKLASTAFHPHKSTKHANCFQSSRAAKWPATEEADVMSADFDIYHYSKSKK